MCGILGLYRANYSPDLFIRALDSLAHRGPDSHGSMEQIKAELVFGHRRLAIIDLSPAGHQPMLSRSGRFAITFNGEIYNYKEIATEIFRESGLGCEGGDTAVMLAAFEIWGVEKTLDKLVGMFAFAVWDKLEETLILARDRIGEKPLYYGWLGNSFIFASELKPFTILAGRKLELEQQALGLLLQVGYVPAPFSIYKDIYKLQAGSLLILSRRQLANPPEEFKPDVTCNTVGYLKRYWSIRPKLLESAMNRSEDLVAELEQLLIKSVQQQMISDVPLGAFLSGGVDSSLIVALMQKLSSRPVKTFSIGFTNKAYDEAPYAREVAAHIGTDHHELYVTEKDALEVIPKLPQIYSEPFADSSQIPTFLVSKLTRQEVTVSLSGDGGDELFGGYGRYVWTQRLWRYMQSTPGFIRSGLSAALQVCPTALIDAGVNKLNYVLPESFKLKNAGAKIQRALSLASVASAEELYLVFLSQKLDSRKVLRNYLAPDLHLTNTKSWPLARDLFTRLMWMDLENYLPDEIFVKVDRAAMAVALESRAPFLDHRVVEFAFSLPSEEKIYKGQGKVILKKLLAKYVPEGLTNRPKMGFGVPLGRWLAGELKPWAEDLLSEGSLNRSGLLHHEPIREVWKQHLLGNYSNQYWLWHVLMFQAWYES